MTQSEGFVDNKYPNKVYKLERSIYRLKQASCLLGYSFWWESQTIWFREANIMPEYMSKLVGV